MDGEKIQMVRDEDGNWVVDAPPPAEPTPSTEAAERPPFQDDGINWLARHGTDKFGF